jgi:hypothetical protein
MSESFTRDKEFKSTKDVYGVDPKILSDMTYKDAEILKYIHARRMHQKVVDEIFSLPLHKDCYDRRVELDMEMKKYEKSIRLAELHLYEIGVDYGKIVWKE